MDFRSSLARIQGIPHGLSGDSRRGSPDKFGPASEINLPCSPAWAARRGDIRCDSCPHIRGRRMPEGNQG